MPIARSAGSRAVKAMLYRYDHGAADVERREKQDDQSGEFSAIDTFDADPQDQHPARQQQPFAGHRGLGPRPLSKPDDKRAKGGGQSKGPRRLIMAAA